MSYYTHVEITLVDGDLASDPHEQQLARVKPRIQKFRSMEHRDGFDELYLDRVEDILSGKLLLMRGYSNHAEEFVRYLSECFPDTIFAARGVGEDFDDLWHFQYANGQRIVETPRRPLTSEQSRADGQMFTRVPDVTARGWRSFIRPVYLKGLLAALILFVVAVIILSTFSRWVFLQPR